VQTPDVSTVTDEFDAHGWRWQRSTAIPSALRLVTEADVTKSDAYRDGRIEIQDLGSQMILAAIGIAPGGRWLDACAGAGGKTLQLASLLDPAGHVDAYDVRADALAELNQRALRAGLENITASSTPPTGLYDGVLVDAPCSGSGTWRRAPHLKWTTTPAQIQAAARRQLALLLEFGARVRPGGRLVYATCSLSHRENEDVVAAFRAAQPDFVPAPFATTFGLAPHAGALTILPARHDTDGFFVATLRRR
jgi:16S rRNA (cytosine967-C5)-methyltransferase